MSNTAFEHGLTVEILNDVEKQLILAKTIREEKSKKN